MTAQTIAAALEARPTLSVGQADSLKVDTGRVRVWLCRCGVADGMPYDAGVSVECLDSRGAWLLSAAFPGGQYEDTLAGWLKALGRSLTASPCHDAAGAIRSDLARCTSTYEPLPGRPYRCHEPAGHEGAHSAIVGGQWPVWTDEGPE